MGVVEKKKKKKEEEEERCSLWSTSSVRLKVVIALALALTIEGLMRSNINMAMVCMVNRTAIEPFMHFLPPNSTDLPSSVISSSSPSPPIKPSKCEDLSPRTDHSKNKNMGELKITKSEQGLIFTSFYAGGLAIVMPGSYLCDWMGARNLVFVGALINVVGSFITPAVARHLGSIALIFVRFVMGCGQGILVPCMNVLIAHWFPLSEKSTAITIATTGNQLSVIVAMLLTAELCQFSWLGGWPSAFYSYAFMGVALCVIWLWFVQDSPSAAKGIRESELNFIHSGEHKYVGKIDPKEVPWSKILGSLVVWSTALCSFSQNFMNVGIVVYLPSYYHRFLKLDIASNGFLSAFPFLIQLFTKIIFAAIADYLRSRELMSHSSVAKMFNLIASVGSGICFLLLAFCDCQHRFLAVSLAVLAIGLSSGFIPGYNTSIVCIAPRYTASVASFSRMLGQIASVASPYMLGFFGDREEWQLAFMVISFVLISTGFVFQCCGSASIQEWARHIPHTAISNTVDKEELAFLAANSSTTT